MASFTRNTSIKRRIYFGFFFVLIMTTSAALVGIYNLGETERGFTRYRQQSDKMNQAIEIDTKVSELQRSILTFSYTGASSVKKQVARLTQSLKAALDKQEKTLTSTEEKELFARMEARLGTYSSTFAKAVSEEDLKKGLVEEKVPQLISALKKSSPRRRIVEIEAALLAYLADPSSVTLARINDAIDIFASAKTSVQSELTQQQSDAEELRRAVLRLSQSTRSSMYLLSVVMAGEALEFKYVSKAMKRLILAESVAIQQNISSQIEKSQRLTLLFLVLFIALGAFAAFIIARGISAPLDSITDTFSQLAEGKTEIVIPEQDRGDEIGLLSKAADVFRRKSLQLEKSNEELAQFSYRTSHDLKAPLTTSKQLAEYISKDITAGDLDEAKQNAQQIVKQMANLEKLVIDILDLAKADVAGDDIQNVDFGLMLEEIFDRHGQMALENSCELRSDIKLNSEIIGDGARFTQVIENLVTNGIKYANLTLSNSYVAVSIAESTDTTSIVVEDNGIGIPEKHHDQIFKMFKRFHPEVSFGSGLGMSIVKKHVDFMKGTIDVSSSPSGTRFDIRFPRQKVISKS